MEDNKQKLTEKKILSMSNKMYGLDDIIVANSYSFEGGKEPSVQTRLFTKNGRFYTEILTGQKYSLNDEGDFVEFSLTKNNENHINVLTFKQALPHYYQMSKNCQLSKLDLWILQKVILSTRTLKQVKQADRDFNLQEIIGGFKCQLENDIKTNTETFDSFDLVEDL